MFAIAITLLILEIRVPHLPPEAGNGALAAELRELWPSFVAFVASFGAILTMWINHHEFFRFLQRIDRPFLYANGFLLLLVTFVPFPTALVATYLDRPGAEAATAFYCGTYVLINVAYNLLWYTGARQRRLVRDGVPETSLHRIRNSYLMAFPIYLGATLLSFWSPLAGFALCTGLWVFWALLSYA